MFDFFKGGRNKKPRPDGLTTGPTPAASGPSSSQMHTATHRELARVVLRDTLRMNGIPTEWLGCESLVRPQGTLLIQLVIHKWHEGLLHYAPILQQQLLLGLQRFDPANDHSGHAVVWKFSPDCGYPHSRMPPPEFWVASPANGGKPKFDLPPSDRDFRRGDDGFAPTVPSELR